MEASQLDEKKLRLYRFLLNMGRITIDDVPEPYKSAVEGDA